MSRSPLTKSSGYLNIAFRGASIRGLRWDCLASLMALSAMFTPWSPIRSKPLLILIAPIKKRRSPGVGKYSAIGVIACPSIAASARAQYNRLSPAVCFCQMMGLSFTAGRVHPHQTFSASFSYLIGPTICWTSHNKRQRSLSAFCYFQFLSRHRLSIYEQSP